MEALVLFDLHYQDANPNSRKKLDEILRIPVEFQAVILGGDNAELSDGLHNHRVLFKSLRERFNCSQGFILGNHELWGRLAHISSRSLLYDIFPAIGQEYGMIYLEQGNLQINETTFVGTYGHFDYSFLREGKGITRDILKKGVFVKGKNKIKWKDIHLMDWEGKNDAEVCKELVSDFERRLQMVSSPQIITISHTLPRLALNGWPDSPEQYFMEAYSGSDLIGDALERNHSNYHFCGHSHIRAEATIGETPAINIGADYDNLRYAIISIEGGRSKVQER